MSTAAHLASGQQAEDQALTALQNKGLRLLHRNYRCPQGELDLVMEDGEALVIVEVRFRRERGFGNAAESVGAGKQRKLLLAAQHLLQQDARLRRKPLRFDVFAITEQRDGVTDSEWIRDAFRA
ncbi:MAG TPA: YraN family protein [Gammaproteobacteria bacterium]|nr:YraN family protein [Gammaproteobacteria bacterium]